MRILVRLAEGRAVDLCWGTYGCVPAIASASLLTSWAKGRTVEEILQYTPEALTAALGGLPPSRRFCAGLAVEALRTAIHDALRQEART